jgi:RND family efflux transporter MFP subunit
VAEIGERQTVRVPTFAGEVRARYEAKIGFRIGGKIVRRAVNVGDEVKAGQLIAELDPTDYALAAEALNAQLRAARSEYDFALSDLKRYRELLDEKLVAPAEYERRETSVSTLKDRVAALKAQYDQAGRQTKYAQLVADHDCVVVALPAEVGQVVAAGQPVATLARLPELEIGIDVPESQQPLLGRNSAVRVQFWAAPETVFEGRVREVAASADSGARTYAVRIALPRRAEWVRLGMSATVAVAGEAAARQVIPLSSVFVPQGSWTNQPHVWALKEDNTVYSVPVSLGPAVGTNEVEVKGLTNGLKVVTAGASRLHESEAVSVLAPFEVGGSLVSSATRTPFIGQDQVVPVVAGPLHTLRKAP